MIMGEFLILQAEIIGILILMVLLLLLHKLTKEILSDMAAPSKLDFGDMILSPMRFEEFRSLFSLDPEDISFRILGLARFQLKLAPMDVEIIKHNLETEAYKEITHVEFMTDNGPVMIRFSTADLYELRSWLKMQMEQMVKTRKPIEENEAILRSMARELAVKTLSARIGNPLEMKKSEDSGNDTEEHLSD